MPSLKSSVMYRHGFLLAIMFCLSQNLVVAYPSGAPTTACVSMQPGHGTSSTVACPYVTIFDKTEMFSNDTLKVTLQAPPSITKTFKGFMVMGFDKATSAVVGTFQISSTDQYSRTLDCSQYDNAATHKNSNTKSSISMDWIPPQGFGGDVEFKTTFLEDENLNFWVKELSETIRITASEPLPTIPTTDPTNTLPIPDLYVGCGETKGCIATPDGCVATKNCSMMTTYKKFDNANLVLEIYGEIAVDQYVAVGFSTDSKMGSDSVVECVQYRDAPKTYQSYNTPDHNNIRLTTNLQVTEEMSSMYVDGYIYCSVKQPIAFKNSNQDFDLNQPHYILMATGKTGKDNIQRHSTEKKSSASINLTSDLGISYYNYNDSRVLKQLHGSFMVIAWLMAASVGVLMPRYMKKTWVGKQFMKKDLWFVYHRGLMVLVWTLTVMAFIIIFVDVGGWVSESISENPHPLLGCITTVLAFIQPFMALMRPMPNAPNRYIFNWAHMLVGYSAHILAITCIFLAVEMKEAELPYETYWILTAHICCYVGAQLLLTILARKNTSVRDVFKEDAPRDETGSLGRKIILSCYICIVVGLGSTVIAFIAGA